MERFLDQAAGHEDVWYATNIEICDYVNAAKQLKYSAAGKYIYNPTVQDIWMRLDPKSEDVVVLKAGEVTRVQRDAEIRKTLEITEKVPIIR